MQQKVLHFMVDGQYIKAPCEKVVADSRNYVAATFHFSTEWQGLTKTAIFKGPDGNVWYMVLEDDRCIVPHEVLQPPAFSVSVFAGDLLTADQAVVQVDASGFSDGVTPPETTPDLYTQLVDTVSAERQLAQAAAVTAGEKADVCNAQALAASVNADDALAGANQARFYADQCTEQAEKAGQAAQTATEIAEEFEDMAQLNARVHTLETTVTDMDINTQHSLSVIYDEQGRLDGEVLELEATTKQTNSNLTTLTSRFNEAEGELINTIMKVGVVENGIMLLNQRLSGEFNLPSTSLQTSSLEDWCNIFATPGVQSVYIGADATNTPATNCIALYICNSDCSHRVMWMFTTTGKLYMRTYTNNHWQNWYAFSGSVFTV